VEASITAREGNFNKLKDSYLKQNKLNAEEIKKDILGDNASKYDIYTNKNTGDLYVGPKVLKPDSELQPIGFRIRNGDLTEGFPLDIPPFLDEGLE
jgi:hypothetical protein